MRLIRRTPAVLVAVILAATCAATAGAHVRASHMRAFAHAVHAQRASAAPAWLKKPPARLRHAAKAHLPKVGQKVPASALRSARHHGLRVHAATATGFTPGAYCFDYTDDATLISAPIISSADNQWYYDVNVGVLQDGTIDSVAGPYWSNAVYAQYGWYNQSTGQWGDSGISLHPHLVYGFNYVGSYDGQYPGEFYAATAVEC